MPDPVLSLRSLDAHYGDFQALFGIDMDISEGEVVAIIGANGAGKTTLLSTLMGLTRLHSGTVALHGQDISALAPFRRNALGLGLVPQTRDIFGSLTVEENLLAAMRGDASLDEAYALFPRLKERRRNGGMQLSGGEQQMLAIARTLMTRPDVVLLDEPLEGLAPVICEQLKEVFEDLAKDAKRSVVLVEQHATAALAFATRAVLMANGAIVHDGPAAGLLQDQTLLNRHVGVGLSE